MFDENETVGNVVIGDGTRYLISGGSDHTVYTRPEVEPDFSPVTYGVGPLPWTGALDWIIERVPAGAAPTERSLMMTVGAYVFVVRSGDRYVVSVKPEGPSTVTSTDQHSTDEFAGALRWAAQYVQTDQDESLSDR